MGLDTEVEKSLLGWAKCFARYKPKKWFVELSRGEDVFQLEPKQILLFNFPSCLQAEIFIIHPLSFPVQMTVDMQEIVTCCNADCLIVEQILFKKKKKREVKAVHQLNAVPGESKCAWWCVQRETCCSWLCPPNSWQLVQAEGPRMWQGDFWVHRLRWGCALPVQKRVLQIQQDGPFLQRYCPLCSILVLAWILLNFFFSPS